MGNVMEMYSPRRLAASGKIVDIHGQGVSGFFCTTGGTLQITEGEVTGGADIISAFTVVAGTFYPLGFFARKGAYAVLGGVLSAPLWWPKLMRRSKLGKPGVGGVVLSALGLSALSVREDATISTVVGAITNKTTGSTLSLTVDGGGAFVLSGTNLLTNLPLDFEATPSYSITIRETLAGAVGTPRDTSFTISVIDILENPALSALTVNTSTYTNGTGASGTISGATSGSTIVLGSAPAGLTINSGARTWAFDGTGTAGSGSFTLTETLAGSPNSPRVSTISWTINASGTSSILAPTLSYPSPLAGPATSIVIGLPFDWAENDVLVFAYSASSSMSSPTLITHTITPTDITNGTMTLPLPGVSGLKYYQAYNRRSGVDSVNKSNIVSSGDTTAPTITTSATANITETFPLAISLTGTDTGGIASWSIVSGADQLQFEVSGTTLRWISNGSQSFSSPLDQGVNNVYDVVVRATDYGGNFTDQAIAVTVQVADIQPDAFTFTDVTGATRSQLYTSNTITIAGLTSGVNAPITITGGQYSKNSGGYTSSAGTVQNGDTIAVQATSSGSYETDVNVVVNIGTPTTSDTYTITTMPDPANISWTAGSAVSGTGSGANINFTNINFTQTGLAIFVVKCTNSVRTTGLTVGGVTATKIDESGAVDAGGHSALYSCVISSTGSKAVQAQQVASRRVVHCCTAFWFQPVILRLQITTV
jgi:hypothetical protein